MRPAERWQPDARFLFGGAAIAFGIGLVVGLLLGLGGEGFQPLGLVLNGVAGLLIFLIICGLMVVVVHRIEPLRGLRRALVLSGVFFVGGGLAWLVVQVLLAVTGLAGSRSWAQLGTSLALNGLLAILFGSGFYLFEATRQRMLESVSRLKEAQYAERELALARSLQSRLLPPPELTGEGYRIAARNLSASFVAGDFYDVFALPDGAQGLVVADVAGKGVGASLVMASVKAVLPLLAAERTVGETLNALNQRLCDELERRQFVALCYARYQPASGELLLANAGLPEPYLLRAHSAPQPLSASGPRLPLGLRRDQTYLTATCELSPGAGLLLVTDGLPEAPDVRGEPLGYETLVRLMPPLGPEPGIWLDRFLESLRRETAPELADDWTALLLQRSS